MELSDEQQKVVTCGDPRVIVQASASSGKTTCLIERLKYLVTHGADPDKIVTITFTNAAAEEIALRLHDYNCKGMYIGTIHGYCNKLLCSHGISTEEQLKNEQFDELFNIIQSKTYCIPEIDYLLYDEAQDSTAEQFKFTLETLAPKQWMIFCDIRQAIYEWNGADPSLIIDLMRREDVVVYHLNNNYRNGKVILDFAKTLIRPLGREYADTSIWCSGIQGTVYPMRMNTGAVVDFVMDDLRHGGNYGDWFILSRTNRNLFYFCDYFKAAKIPFSTFKRSDLSFEQIKQEMDKDTIKVLTVHGAKGLEAKKVAVVGVTPYSTEERRIQYVAATRAKELLVWANLRNQRPAAKDRFKMQDWT